MEMSYPEFYRNRARSVENTSKLLFTRRVKYSFLRNEFNQNYTYRNCMETLHVDFHRNLVTNTKYEQITIYPQQ
jgi:hypothetical protein